MSDKRFLDEQHQRQDNDHRHDTQHRPLLVPPGFLPERFGRNGRVKDELLGQLIVKDGDKAEVCAILGRSSSRNLKPEGGGRVEAVPDLKDAAFLHRWRAIYGKPIHANVTLVSQLVAFRALKDDHAVKDMGLFPFRSPMGLNALGANKQRNLSCAKPSDSTGEKLLAEQILPDGWRVEYSHPQIKKGAIAGTDWHFCPGKGFGCGLA